MIIKSFPKMQEPMRNEKDTFIIFKYFMRF